MKSYVYRNLRTKTFSVMEAGRVVDHPHEVVLIDAKFVVRKAGRERVLKERRKSVHAFVVGARASYYEVDADAIPVRYNPYESEKFRRVDSNEPVEAASLVWLTPHGLFAKL